MLNSRVLMRYGVLGIPLAFAGLPVYVHVPKFYADVLHMDLAILGGLLLVLRLFDAIIDPIIGILSDRYHSYSRVIMMASIPLLILGYAALFNPTEWAMAHSVIWLSASLLLVYVGFSTLMINYYAMGAEMADGYHDHTRIASFRESFMLLGVLLASLLPTLLQSYMSVRSSYTLYGFLLAPLLILCAWPCLTVSYSLRREGQETPTSFFKLLSYSDVRWVLSIGFLNAIPGSITSTLFLFFTHDILQADKQSGPLLAFYFLSAACAMPFWTKLSLKIGKKKTLLIAMTTSIFCFMWAITLGAGDLGAFAVICCLSGVTVGADLLLLPSLLGDALANKGQATAMGFGLWNLTSKLTMAFAAGIVLPLLGYSGYHSSAVNDTHALRALSFCYALLPCVFKAVAILMLSFSPIDRRRNENG